MPSDDRAGSNGPATFKGIPYAGSVSGANRFKAAPPLQPWTGVRDALLLGAPCSQPGRTPGRGNEPLPDENCLFLNIWTPASDGRKRPVMFYSHGGGFITGSGGAAYQDGGNLARIFGVVVVATNHRLGLLSIRGTSPDPRPAQSIYSVHYLYQLQLASRIAGVPGKQADASAYAGRAAAVSRESQFRGGPGYARVRDNA